MKICPNCFKKLNEKFTYCNKCGVDLDDGGSGKDLKTDYLNVFRKDEGFIYVFAVHGRQVILNADSIDELQKAVQLNKFPWRKLKEDNSALLNTAPSEDFTISEVTDFGKNFD